MPPHRGPSRHVNTLNPSLQGPELTGTVRIPFHELRGRVHELPSPLVDLGIVKGSGFDEASEFARSTSRAWHEVEPPHLASEPENNRLWQPPRFLEQVELGPPGRALCLGCGSGREAVWLAERGWSVVAIDWLEDALELGCQLQSRHPGEKPIEWLCLDLRTASLGVSGFDLITQFFFLEPSLFDQFHRLLTPGGRVVMETFSPEQHAKFGSPKLARTLDVNLALPGLEMTLARSADADGRLTTQLVAAKPG